MRRLKESRRGPKVTPADAIAALDAFATVTRGALLAVYRDNTRAAENLVRRERRRFSDLADAAHAQVDATVDRVHGPDEALAEGLEAAEAAAHERLLTIRRALSEARLKYGITRQARDHLRDHVIRERGRNRFDVADLEHAPVRRPVVAPRCRPRRNGPSGRPGYRVRRGACRAGPGDDDGPEPAQERVRRPDQSERRRPW